MADIKRSLAELLTLFEDGQASNSITEQDLRDLIVSYPNLKDFGWTSHHDSQFSSGSPQNITTRSALTSNDGGELALNSNRPQPLIDAGQTGFYDTTTQKIDVSNIGLNDILHYRITAIVKPSNSNVVASLELQIEDSPAVIIGTTTITFPDTAPRQFSLSTTTFVLQNFIDDGAKIYIAVESGNVDVWDFKLLINRMYISP